MTLAMILGPVATLLAIVSIYHLYVVRHASRDSQQFIALTDPSYRTVRGVARFQSDTGHRTSGVFNRVGADGATRGVSPDLFRVARARIAVGFGRRMVLEGDTVLTDERFIDTLICTGDLIVRGDCAFLAPVKVSGDLIIEGNASFDRPVIVNGHTRIVGLAAIFAGMVAKGELSVEGTLLVGEHGREGWLAASHVEASGQLLLNGYIDTIETPSRTAACVEENATTARPNALTAMAIAIIGYLLSIPLGGWALGKAGIACSDDLTLLHCVYPAQAASNGGVWALGAFAIAIHAAGRRWFRETIAWPFVATLSVVAVIAVGYDLLAARPVLQESRIVSDTMNVLGFVMLASFMLTLAILRRGHVPLRHVAAAVAVSFGAKTVAMLAFAAIRGSLGGASEMLVLFVVYAFGAFGTHLMAVTSLVRHARPVVGRALVQGEDNTRAGAVDGLRGLAILLVVVYHYVPSHFFSFNLGKPINSILFVVAGFFFAALLLKNAETLQAGATTRLRTVGEILIRRHVRIWPALVAVVAMYAVLGAVDGGPLTQQIWTTWPYYLTYSGYIPRWAYEATAFPSHLWVVSAQETLLALLCGGMAVFGLPKVRATLWVFVVAGIVARLAGTLMFMPHYPALALETPFAVLDPLALGMLARFGMDRSTLRSRLRRRIAMALLCAIALWVVLPNWNSSYFTLTPLIAALATTLIMVLSADRVRGRGIGRAGLAAPWLVFLGKLSLPLFLLHPLVNTVLRLCFTQMTGIEMPWWLLFAVGPCLSIMAAWGFHRVIEEPLKRMSASLTFRPVPLSLGPIDPAPLREPVFRQFATPVGLAVERRKRAA
jgi:peptidoglycan/LPS O-acetylase OafA/YrhL